jgi:hypothetical protein
VKHGQNDNRRPQGLKLTIEDKTFFEVKQEVKRNEEIIFQETIARIEENIYI